MVHISGPRRFTHGKHQDLGDDRLLRLCKDKPDRLGDVRRVLEHARVEVGKPVEQEWRSHAASDDGRDLDVVRPGLDVQGMAQPEQPPLAGVVGRGIGPGTLGGRRDDVDDVPVALADRMGPSASFDIRNGPRRLTARIRSQSASESSSTGTVKSTPALLTRMSSRAKLASRSAR